MGQVDWRAHVLAGIEAWREDFYQNDADQSHAVGNERLAGTHHIGHAELAVVEQRRNERCGQQGWSAMLAGGGQLRQADGQKGDGSTSISLMIISAAGQCSSFDY